MRRARRKALVQAAQKAAENEQNCPACGVHLFLCDCHNQTGEPVQVIVVENPPQEMLDALTNVIVSQDDFRLTPED